VVTHLKIGKKVKWQKRLKKQSVKKAIERVAEGRNYG